MRRVAERILVMADVHANLAALEAVLEAAEGCEACIFLGDIVGYGPQPLQCVRLLREFSATMPTEIVLGNHDSGGLEADPGNDGTAIANGSEWDAWTARQLGADDRAWLAQFPQQATTDIVGMAATMQHYLRVTSSHIDDGALADEVDRAAQVTDTPGLLFGHYHRQVDTSVHGTRCINPGSVGQQRGGCPEARFAVCEAGCIDFRHVQYGVESTIAALSDIPMSERYARVWGENYRLGIVDLAAEREIARNQ